MRRVVLVLPLVLAAAACADAPVAPGSAVGPAAKRVPKPTPVLSSACSNGRHFDQAVITLSRTGATLATVTVAHFVSDRNEWVNLGGSSQPDGVTIVGPGRVQYAAGRTEAAGVLAVAAEGGAVTVDLAQLDGRTTSPFVATRAGGLAGGTGAIVVQATVATRTGSATETVRLSWQAYRAP